MRFFRTKGKLSLVVIILSSWMGPKGHAAELSLLRLTGTISPNHRNLFIVQQICPGTQEVPQPFARVTVQQGNSLTVRSSPDGKAIGSIPNGWDVVVIRQDATGRWARITSHLGEEVGGPTGFGSAPLFQPGWVDSSALVYIGNHCDKPGSSMSTSLQTVGRTLKVQEDWLEIGDRIAQSLINELTHKGES
jgi:hypothetical protein